MCSAHRQPEVPRAPFLGDKSSLHLDLPLTAVIHCSGGGREGQTFLVVGSPLLLSDLPPSIASNTSIGAVGGASGYFLGATQELSSTAQAKLETTFSGPWFLMALGDLLPTPALALGSGISLVPPFPPPPQGGCDRLG